MGFLDKLKEGAGQAKDIAGQAVDRAKEEAKELQLKRELGQAQGDLGKAAFDLVEQGALSHPELDAGVARIRELKVQLADFEAGAPASTEPPAADA